MSLFIFLFFLGLCIGSFLNVVVDWAVGKRKSLFTPPSFCDSCGHRLSFWDLIPVFSFIALRRKCRYCGERILLSYLLVELATGLLFALSPYTSVLLAGRFYPIPYTLFLFSILVVVFVSDLRFGLIPDRVILPAITFALSYSLFITPYSLFPAFFSAGSFLALYLLTRGRGLGLGDVKLSFFLGLTLGFPHVLMAVYLALVFGGLIAGMLLILGKKRLRDEIPLGPFLVMGTILTMFFGDSMLGLANRLIGLKIFLK
jgi:prepilin signal peptidase PulO-like enzyme (type II secretory pathway)